MSSYALPGTGAMPSAIAAGPGGTLWFTLNQGNAIGRITTGGEVSTYPLPTPSAGPDEALWFVEIGAGQAGRMSTSGAITELPLPDRATRPHAIVAGPDGALWFTEWGAGRPARVTTEGKIQEFPLEGADPHGLAVGPDGAMWVAMEAGALTRHSVQTSVSTWNSNSIAWPEIPARSPVPELGMMLP